MSTEAQERIREYALELILSAAQSGIDDDLDEDGELESEEEWRAALDLAQKIVNGMNNDSDALLEFAGPDEDDEDDEDDDAHPMDGA